MSGKRFKVRNSQIASMLRWHSASSRKTFERLNPGFVRHVED
jgi:hypothetical protein